MRRRRPKVSAATKFNLGCYYRFEGSVPAGYRLKRKQSLSLSRCVDFGRVLISGLLPPDCLSVGRKRDDVENGS